MENIRPTFLTVLCILTFIGSGSSIYSGITNYSSPDVSYGLVNERFDKVEEELGNQEGTEAISELLQSARESITPEKIKNNGMATSLTSIITLIGAILMWGLRKTGFYVYVTGAIAAVIAPISIFGGFTGAVASAGAAIAGILFIILYGLNLKHLR
ncbi:hypothetical protein [Leadbetterella sp. DM7]|uniref:hypothetical protein n=1 Tax=Leadbetterella sp. DM7 TaxID=3235085 RepID=UPI00349EC23A